jgi:hypothetical protein
MMRSRVVLVSVEGGYELTLEELQFGMIKNTLIYFLNPTPPRLVCRALIGVDKDELWAVVDRARIDAERARVYWTLSLDELHSIYAALAGAYVRSRSEEDFYIKTGYFRENVRGVVDGLTEALKRVAETPSGQQ